MKKLLLASVLATGLLSSGLMAKTIELEIGKKDVASVKSDVSIATEYIIRTNQYVCDSMYVYEMNVAGIAKKDIKIKIIDNDIMNVSITRTIPSDSVNSTFNLTENRYGTYERSFTLPRNANIDKLETSLENGMLFITFPIMPYSELNSTKEIFID